MITRIKFRSDKSQLRHCRDSGDDACVYEIFIFIIYYNECGQYAYEYTVLSDGCTHILLNMCLQTVSIKILDLFARVTEVKL